MRFNVEKLKETAWHLVPRALREPAHVTIGAAERWSEVSGPQQYGKVGRLLQTA